VACILEERGFVSVFIKLGDKGIRLVVHNKASGFDRLILQLVEGRHLGTCVGREREGALVVLAGRRDEEKGMVEWIVIHGHRTLKAPHPV
jgi:hypothetical protein